MRVRNAVMRTLSLAGLALGGACSSGTGLPGSGGGSGGGPPGTITVGSGIQFVSSHNGTMNPAVDTVPVGGTVTWRWRGGLPHSVQSTGSPSFESSNIRTGNGTYAVTFATPGTYRYTCIVHGAEMTGTIVAQ